MGRRRRCRDESIPEETSTADAGLCRGRGGAATPCSALPVGIVFGWWSGATPDEMRARGFRPVGRDFPVFLHPHTNEEYALARTERKSGHGYTGFVCHASPEVTLEEDLLRRDLTINAIARTEDGRLIDPYGGRRDLAARVFRHVSPAFAEDPLRILRVARFSARFTDFELAPVAFANELLEAFIRMTTHNVHLPVEGLPRNKG